MRQNHRIIRRDACDPSSARNVCRQPVVPENLIRTDRDWPAEIESSHHNQRCFLSFGVVSENSIRRRFRVVRQNHYIIRIDVCDPAWARNVRRRPVCTENLIRVDEVRESRRLTR